MDQATVGRRFLELRGTAGRAATARRMGMSDRTLERLEKGTARSDPNTVRTAALYYGVSPGPLLRALGHDTLAADWEPVKDGPSPDALRTGHGGSEGWPPWLESMFRDLEAQVAALAERMDALEDSLRSRVR